MLKDITLGQFFPGNSLLHRADPRIKIISSLIYIIAVFMCSSLVSYAFVILLTAIMIAFSGVPAKIILKGLKPLMFIIAFTTVYNVFFYNGTTLLCDLKIVDIYLEGIIFAVIMALRIVCLLVGSGVLLTYTTSPIVLTDGIESLLDPLKKIKVPVHEFAMMMSIALRFIPTLVEETDKIMSAQKARGADFSSGGLIQRAKALIPVLIPLFVSAFRRASDLAVAMECRCYRGGNGRTKMKKLKIHCTDIIILLVFIISCVVIALINKFIPVYSI